MLSKEQDTAIRVLKPHTEASRLALLQRKNTGDPTINENQRNCRGRMHADAYTTVRNSF
jgi:hypothetical protein